MVSAVAVTPTLPRPNSQKELKQLAQYNVDLHRALMVYLSGMAQLTNESLRLDADGNLDVSLEALNDTETTAWSPIVTSSVGAITTSSATGKYTKLGSLYIWDAALTITTNGTGASAVSFNLPFTSVDTGVGYGREIINSSFMLQVVWGAASSSAFVLNYDGTYPGSDGAVLQVAGHFRV